MDFDVMRMISTKSAGKTLADRFAVVRTSFGFHLRECVGGSFPPPRPTLKVQNLSDYPGHLIN